MSDDVWVSTGESEMVDSDELNKIEETFEKEVVEAIKKGEHYWFALVGFRVTLPLKPGMNLDHESLRMPPKVGCYICEAYWEEAPEACPGPPE